ncbi:MAG TPA: hypothetical protein VFN55_05775 [Solirubrobacteraceae bacterium]|nr:hypothetical protein [Solirubrobacteraceae bacterium]
MLILPPGHAETLRQPRSFQRREKVMLSGVLAVVAALVVVLALSLGSGETHSRNGCISVGLAYSTGGETINRCGAAARAMCAGVNQPGGTKSAAAHALTTECRKAGLPIG